ncbi:MAG: hypothetical protein KatS3mg117_1444 [Geminicoccaceae bacterium]|nr:MAG: hypothetical protein KatS3mg117_1444 [Geminicoccaceae bacterium]
MGPRTPDGGATRRTSSARSAHPVCAAPVVRRRPAGSRRCPSNRASSRRVPVIGGIAVGASTPAALARGETGLPAAPPSADARLSHDRSRPIVDRPRRRAGSAKAERAATRPSRIHDEGPHVAREAREARRPAATRAVAQRRIGGTDPALPFRSPAAGRSPAPRLPSARAPGAGTSRTGLRAGRPRPSPRPRGTGRPRCASARSTLEPDRLAGTAARSPSPCGPRAWNRRHRRSGARARVARWPRSASAGAGPNASRRKTATAPRAARSFAGRGSSAPGRDPVVEGTRVVRASNASHP